MKSGVDVYKIDAPPSSLFLFWPNSVQCTGPSSLNLYQSTQLVIGQIIVTTNDPSERISTHYYEPLAAAGKNTCLFLLFFLNFLAQLDQFGLLLFLKVSFFYETGWLDCESWVNLRQWSLSCSLLVIKIIEKNHFSQKRWLDKHQSSLKILRNFTILCNMYLVYGFFFN